MRSVKALFRWLVSALSFFCALAFLSLGNGTLRHMPGNAVLLTDGKAYFAHECVSDDVAQTMEVIRADEAYSKKLKPDSKCVNSGAFIEDGRSPVGLFLQKIGMLQPLPSRWNPDGTWTDWGPKANHRLFFRLYVHDRRPEKDAKTIIEQSPGFTSDTTNPRYIVTAKATADLAACLDEQINALIRRDDDQLREPATADSVQAIMGPIIKGCIAYVEAPENWRTQ